MNLSENLYILTLSLSEAVQQKRLEEISMLVTEREAIIQTLQNQTELLTPEDHKFMEKVLREEAKIAQALAEIQDDMLQEMMKLNQKRKGLDIYHRQSHAS